MKYHKLSWLIKGSLFIACCWLSTNVFAEYYIVTSYPISNGCYNSCYNSCYSQPCGTYVYIRSTAPYRHAERSSDQMEEYAWIGDP